MNKTLKGFSIGLVVINVLWIVYFFAITAMSSSLNRQISYSLSGNYSNYGAMGMFFVIGLGAIILFALSIGLGVTVLVLSIVKLPKTSEGRGLLIAASIMTIAGFVISWFPFMMVVLPLVTVVLLIIGIVKANKVVQPIIDPSM